MAVSHEAIHLWCNKFGSEYARRLRRKHQGYGDAFLIDEVLVKIQGKQHYLWRVVDQDGDVVDVFIQKRRDSKATKRFFVFHGVACKLGNTIRTANSFRIITRLFVSTGKSADSLHLLIV